MRAIMVTECMDTIYRRVHILWQQPDACAIASVLSSSWLSCHHKEKVLWEPNISSFKQAEDLGRQVSKCPESLLENIGQLGSSLEEKYCSTMHGDTQNGLRNSSAE